MAKEAANWGNKIAIPIVFLITPSYYCSSSTIRYHFISNNKLDPNLLYILAQILILWQKLNLIRLVKIALLHRHKAMEVVSSQLMRDHVCSQETDRTIQIWLKPKHYKSSKILNSRSYNKIILDHHKSGNSYQQQEVDLYIRYIVHQLHNRE